ncbi:hypothetical protein [Mycobacterium uberis]|uniref:hypothetical protein n=1 Tax=Mycobacterium uberis TaxID=2162698 RepID=UPI001FB36719|nr:hypothetical protein [Mycobacterium uberis]
MTDNPVKQLSNVPVFAWMLYKLALPIFLFWVGLVVVLRVFGLSLDVAGKEHLVSMSPHDALSVQAMKRVGQVFNGFNTDSAISIVLEDDK